jgi:hypothetical protein
MWARESLQVERDISNLRLAVNQGFTIRGNVAFRSSTQTSPPDFSRQGINIVIVPVEDVDFGAMPLTLPDSAGRFQSVGLPGGQYVIDIQRPIPGWYLSSITLGQIDLTNDVINLDYDIDGVSIVFTDQPSRIRGFVKDRQGAPANSLVMLIPSKAFESSGTRSDLRRMVVVRTSTSGSYSIDPFPGSYRLIALSGKLRLDDVFDLKFIQSVGTGAQPMEVPVGSSVEQNLVAQAVR